MTNVHANQPTHPYVARCIPEGMCPEDVETAADCGALREVRLRAPNGSWARASAHHITGLPVHSVERIEDVAQAS